MKNIVLISQVAISFLAPLLLGLFLGRKLDEWLKLNGFFAFIFLIVGILSGFLNVYRLIMSTNREKKDS